MRILSHALVPSILLVACGTAPPPSTAPDVSASILDEELAATLESPDVTSALAVVLDARSGRVLAMQSLSRGARDPELPARERFSHGSVAKTFTFAVALDRGAITTTDRFDGAPLTMGSESISDREEHGSMSVEDALAFSSNVAAAHVLEHVGTHDLLAGLRALHLDVPAEADDGLAVRIADGPGLEATPLEIASAFAAVVNGGTYHAPWRDGDAATPGERVLSERTSSAMRALLEAAVAREDGTGHRAAIRGRRVGGKTGTMMLPLASSSPAPDAVSHTAPLERRSSAAREPASLADGEQLEDGGTRGCFVGAVPIDDPRFVVVVDVVASSTDYSGGTLAAPAFARIAERWMHDAH